MEGEAPLAVCLAASPRARANSTLLAADVMDELAARGCRCELVRLAEHQLLPCLAHDRCAELRACPRRDDMSSVLDLVYAADVLVLATPVYYENVAAQLKLFMDRNMFRYTHDQWLRARAVGLIAVTAETGLGETVAAMRRYVALSTRSDPLVLDLAVFADAQDEASADHQARRGARELGRELAEALGLSPA